LATSKSTPTSAAEKIVEIKAGPFELALHETAELISFERGGRGMCRRDRKYQKIWRAEDRFAY